MTAPGQESAIQLAAAHCRLMMLGDVAGRIELMQAMQEQGPLIVYAVIEVLAREATTVGRTGRGAQPVETWEQLLGYYEDLAALAAHHRGQA